MSNLEQASPAEAPDQPAKPVEGRDWSEISREENNSKKGEIPVAPKNPEVTGYPLPDLVIDHNSLHPTKSADGQQPSDSHQNRTKNAYPAPIE